MYNAYLGQTVEALIKFGLLFAFLALGLLLGLTALAIAWGGRRAGMLIGVLALGSSLLGLASVLLVAPHWWWIAILPLAIGVATVRSWFHHAGAAVARWPQFGLRGLLILLVLISLVLAGIASNVRQTEVEEAAATALTSLAGARSTQVIWEFGRVKKVPYFTLDEPADFDRAADALERFSQLHTLQISVPLPGRCTQRIARLTTLRTLFAQRMQVTDDDLRALANLQNLEYLDLDASQLTDAGLVHLLSLQKLRVLHLYRADKITPAAMAKLRAGLRNLDHP